MDPKYETLFTPWQVGNVTIKNRIVLCPMGGTSLFGWMERNGFDREAADFFLERAENGAGLIIPGIAPLRDPIGNRWLYQNTKMFEELRVFMEKIHATGAKLFVQLTAGFGRSFAITQPLVAIHNNPVLALLARPVIDVRYLCASPSELPSRWSEKVTCREMRLSEIAQIVKAFAKTGALLREAGVDGVEIHAVHEGYLLDQFTLPYTNQRTDRYGGSFENRYRLPVEIVKAIKRLCGDDYPVSLRFSAVSKTKGFGKGALPGEEYTEAGRSREECERAVKLFEEAGVDLLNCDNGTYDAWYWSHPPQYMPENCNLEDAAFVKENVSIPVICAGKMTPDAAAEAIEAGRIDAMGVARQFLADGEWVRKLETGREEDIRPCIRCHNGCFNMAHWRGTANVQDFSDTRHMARCALDPTVMQRNKYKFAPVLRKKKIAVIGGGIAGMEAALLLSKRGHSVTLYEKSDRLGGVFNVAAAPSFKEADKALIRWYCRAIAKSNVEVRFSSEITDVTKLRVDEIIIATGARARKLPVKGIERAIDAVDYLNGAEVGENIVIVGGGLTGCEIAYDLILKGKKPVIVEMQKDLIPQKGVCLANASFLRDTFQKENLSVFLNTKLAEIGESTVTVRTKKENVPFEIPADTVILSVGYRPSPLKTENSANIHRVGDCDEVGNLRTVIWNVWDECVRI